MKTILKLLLELERWYQYPMINMHSDGSGHLSEGFRENAVYGCEWDSYEQIVPELKAHR